MLKTPDRLVSIDFLPLFARHLVKHRVAGDAGIVDQHVDRAEVGLHLFDAGRAGIVVGDRPFVDGDAGFRFEPGGSLVVAGIVRRDLVAGVLQRHRDRSADAARSTRDDCHPCHVLLLVDRPSSLAAEPLCSSNVAARFFTSLCAWHGAIFPGASRNCVSCARAWQSRRRIAAAPAGDHPAGAHARLSEANASVRYLGDGVRRANGAAGQPTALLPRTWRRPCRRRCKASPGPSWRRGAASRRPAC